MTKTQFQIGWSTLSTDSTISALCLGSSGSITSGFNKDAASLIHNAADRASLACVSVIEQRVGAETVVLFLRPIGA